MTQKMMKPVLKAIKPVLPVLKATKQAIPCNCELTFPTSNYLQPKENCTSNSNEIPVMGPIKT